MRSGATTVGYAYALVVLLAALCACDDGNGSRGEGSGGKGSGGNDSGEATGLDAEGKADGSGGHTSGSGGHTGTVATGGDGTQGGSGGNGAGGSAGGSAGVDAGDTPDTRHCDGGYLDPTTSLCWQDPPDDTRRTLQDAETYCGDLALGGHLDWRVPTIDEGRSLIRECNQTAAGGACPAHEGSSSVDLVADCYGCDVVPGSCHWPAELSGDCSWFHWSSSPVADYPAEGAWFLYYINGSVNWESVQEQFMVRCVRDGP